MGGGSIATSYHAHGTVFGTSFVGGAIGLWWGGTSAPNAVYAMGNVSGTGSVNVIQSNTAGNSSATGAPSVARFVNRWVNTLGATTNSQYSSTQIFTAGGVNVATHGTNGAFGNGQIAPTTVWTAGSFNLASTWNRGEARIMNGVYSPTLVGVTAPARP
jgi:hypothetical protein